MARELPCGAFWGRGFIYMRWAAKPYITKTPCTVWVTIQPKAGDQLGEEANVSPVARAVVPQVWQLEAPFLFGKGRA